MRESLAGQRILVVEDEYFLAEELERNLTRVGAVVVGPVANVENALALIQTETKLDAALLDVNLGGDRVYPVADKLQALGVPFFFATGYNGRDLPARWRNAPRLDKGLHDRVLIPRIAQVVADAREADLKRT